MKAGEYWIGDLCYVLTNDAVWDELHDLCFPPDRANWGDREDGEFTLKDGRKVATFGTAYGDGCYNDNKGNIGGAYPVDSGSIGCILVSDITDKDANLKLGVIHKFEKDFDTDEDSGIIVFGDVEIYTGDYDPNHGDDYDDFDEEDEDE